MKVWCRQSQVHLICVDKHCISTGELITTFIRRSKFPETDESWVSAKVDKSWIEKLAVCLVPSTRRMHNVLWEIENRLGPLLGII